MSRYKPKARARTTRRLPGQMNRTEAEYAVVLRQGIEDGIYARFDFEPETFRLAPKTTYTPDFRVITVGGEVEFHEVKACMSNGAFLCEDDAKVKIKVAAELHDCYVFRLCGLLPKKLGGGWRIEVVG